MTDTTRAALITLYRTMRDLGPQKPRNEPIFEALRSLGHRFRDIDAKLILAAERALDRSDIPGAAQVPNSSAQVPTSVPIGAAQVPNSSTRGARADHSGVVIDSAQGLDSNTHPPSPSQPKPVGSDVSAEVEIPVLFAVQPPVAKPKKPARVISAYAGTTLESFGPLTPLVTAVLAADGHGTDTKIFAKSLETLAMWRALYGDAALAYGLGEAASRHKGHRYVGPCARGYQPDEHRTPLRAVGGAPDQERRAEDPPSRLELVAAGLSEPIGENDIPPHQRPPWHPLHRPLQQAATA